MWRVYQIFFWTIIFYFLISRYFKQNVSFCLLKQNAYIYIIFSKILLVQRVCPFLYRSYHEYHHCCSWFVRSAAEQALHQPTYVATYSFTRASTVTTASTVKRGSLIRYTFWNIWRHTPINCISSANHALKVFVHADNWKSMDVNRAPTLLLVHK